tara:strand:+ start:82 stop:729 length:648 start_codon:yes stop_codon:yes gene_type:complete
MKNVVDIIILSYNRKDFLLEIIEKLNNQTVKQFNLIIVDDGSKFVLDPNTIPNLTKYMWSKDNGYHRVSRLNEAVSFVESEYFIILDDDCVPIHNTFIETHINTLKKYDVSMGLLKFIEGGTNHGWFGTANIGFRTESFRQIGCFDTSYDGHYGHEDTDLGETVKLNGLKQSQFNDQSSALHKGKMYKDGDRTDVVIGHNSNVFKTKWGKDYDKL